MEKLCNPHHYETQFVLDNFNFVDWPKFEKTLMYEFVFVFIVIK
jgi:hypothetical protein